MQYCVEYHVLVCSASSNGTVPQTLDRYRIVLQYRYTSLDMLDTPVLHNQNSYCTPVEVRLQFRPTRRCKNYQTSPKNKKKLHQDFYSSVHFLPVHGLQWQLVAARMSTRLTIELEHRILTCPVLSEAGRQQRHVSVSFGGPPLKNVGTENDLQYPRQP